MGRPRKPTAVLELVGAFKKNKKRRRSRAQEPKPVDGLGPPPKNFDEGEKERWRELVKLCAKGVLKQSDRVIAESIAILWAKLRRREISDKQWTLLDRQLGKIGFNPSDRSKIEVPDSDDNEDPLAKYTKHRA